MYGQTCLPTCSHFFGLNGGGEEDFGGILNFIGFSFSPPFIIISRVWNL